MIETTLVCRHTGHRQPVADSGALPGTWLHIDRIITSAGTETDLHFASWDELGAWSIAQAARQRLPTPVPFLDRHRVA